MVFRQLFDDNFVFIFNLLVKNNKERKIKRDDKYHLSMRIKVV